MIPLENAGFNFTKEVEDMMAIGFYEDGTVAPLYETGKWYFVMS